MEYTESLRTSAKRQDWSYPKNQIELETLFRTEQQCRDFILELRGGFVCRDCGHKEYWQRAKSTKYACKKCRVETSVLVGTIFEDSRVPLTTWFRAIWLMVADKHGVSATSLERQLGIGSHKTSWTLLHKIRRAMVTPDREKLKGEVEVDEFWLGAPVKGAVGRTKAPGKIIALIAVEVVDGKKGKMCGRVRMEVTDDTTADTMHDFITRNIERGSHLHTDANPSYNRMSIYGYKHTSKKGNLLPQAHRAISQFRRFNGGTLQYSAHKEHLNEYFDEFAFRFNRKSWDRGKLFLRVLENAIKMPPTQYKAIVKHCSTRAKQKPVKERKTIPNIFDIPF